ncbi:MAG: sialidase family protein [Candidatus Latescibacterota bacterium]
MPANVKVKVVSHGESVTDPLDCRMPIVGPGINQPDPFPGYGGFVGFSSPARLRNGTWLVGFLAGYSHLHGPSPMDYYTEEELAHVRESGYALENYYAPTGARAMFVRSNDEGKTWSKPATLIDTPANDAHPFFLELPTGTILCSFFTAWGCHHRNDPALAYHVRFIRSFDGGFTWEQEPRLLPSPFLAEETEAPMLHLEEGAVLIAVDGDPREGGPQQAAIFRTMDQGDTWELLSIVKAAHELSEPAIAQLPDGRLVMIARPKGAISWSEDCGRTWTQPQSFGIPMYAPSLQVLQDGNLLCLHGSYSPGHGALRAILSPDGGKTWRAPAPDHGFLVDRTYGYGKGMLLPDGSLFISYMSTGGHAPQDARTNCLWSVRLRVRADCAGIDLLPAAR